MKSPKQVFSCEHLPTTASRLIKTFKQVQIISETKQNHVNIKAKRGLNASEIGKYIISFFFNDKGFLS